MNFYFDVGRKPSWRHLVIRDDPAGAFEPGKARWQIGGPDIDGGDRPLGHVDAAIR